MLRKNSFLTKLFLVSLISFLHITLFPKHAQAETTPEGELPNEISLIKVVNSIKLDDDLHFLEGTQLYGNLTNEEAIIQTGTDKYYLPLSYVEIQSNTDVKPIYAESIVDAQINNYKTNGVLEFSLDLLSDKINITSERNHSISLYKDENESVYTLIGQTKFYLNNPDVLELESLEDSLEESKIEEAETTEPNIEETDKIEEILTDGEQLIIENNDEDQKLTLGDSEKSGFTQESEIINNNSSQVENNKNKDIQIDEIQATQSENLLEEENVEPEVEIAKVALANIQSSPSYKPWTNEKDKYFKVMTDNTTVYDNRSGSLIPVGYLPKDGVYLRIKDYGRDWHQIQFGDHYGYVYKPATTVASREEISNINDKYNQQRRKVKALEDITVYDNSKGRLDPFGVINKGILYPITSDYGDWWRVLLSDRVGYIYKGSTKTQFLKEDEFFKADTSVSVYDNRTGKLVPVGSLVEGETYRRTSDYGNDWHQIQFGDHHGYVYKPATSVSNGSSIKNLNKGPNKTERKFEANENLTVYDNSTGSLVPFGVLNKGTEYRVMADYGADWWRVQLSNRIGYVLKSHSKVESTNSDNYFRAFQDAPIYDNRSGKLDKVGEVQSGEVYEIVSSYGDWWRVQFGDIYGYVYKAATGFANKNEVQNLMPHNVTTQDKVKTTTDVLVYKNTSGNPVSFGKIDADTTFPILNQNGKWLEVSYLGRKGYIFEDGIQKSTRIVSYDLSLAEALQIQLDLNAQTDKRYSYVNKDYIKDNLVTAKTLNVRSGAGTWHDKVGELTEGTKVNIVDEYNNWYVIDYSPKYKISGYVSKDYISDNIVTANVLNVRSEPGLKTKDNPNIDTRILTTLRKNETVNIVNEVDGWYEIETFINRQWVNASPKDVAYYLNPDNFTSDVRQRLQFMDLSNTVKISADILNKFLNNKGILSGQGQAFVDAANAHNVNVIYLISHALLETGHGTSRLAQGTIANGTNTKVYNMFGIGAFDRDPIRLGTERAYNEGWTTPYKAIVGGARFIGNSYLDAGLNTLYKMRWNPLRTRNSYGTVMQYATDIGWASKQVNMMYTILNETGYDTLFFEIPDYRF